MQILRRHFLGTLGAATLGAFVPSARATNRDALVCLFLRGGMDGLNTVVPWRDARYYALRPTIAVPPPGSGGSTAIDLDGRFGLHPALAPLQPLFTAGELAIIHAAGHTNADRSHFTAQALVESATTVQPLPAGWLARYASAGGLMEGGVSVSRSLPASMQGWTGAVAVSDAQSFRIRSRHAATTAPVLRTLFGDAGPIGDTARACFDFQGRVSAANPGALPVDNGASYPKGALGNALQQTASFIKAGLGQTFCIDAGGWDHHANLVPQLSSRLTELGTALAAFHADLGARMNSVTVITMTEFGRRAQENASGGADHGHASCMFALGGGVAGGRVYGDWPGLEETALNDGDLEITTDYRSVLSELLVKRMGASRPMLPKILPDFTPASELGVFRAT